VEVAVTGRADALVTGNSHHFDVRNLAGTLRVVVPADLLVRRSAGGRGAPLRGGARFRQTHRED
jgi:hypothetical protein